MIEKSKVAFFSGHRKLPQNCTELQANLEKLRKVVCSTAIAIW